MRLKSFQAKSMSEAMRQIKETLGDDAIIVSTKEEAGGWVRVTAAVEQAAPAEAAAPAAVAAAASAAGGRTQPAAMIEEEPDDEAIIDCITDALLKHRVPAAVSDKILSAAMTVAGTDAKTTLTKALQKTFGFRELHPKKGNGPVILVGPPGAGKTLMTAKLAARHVMEGHRPAIITTDLARAGGIEQLEAFLNILSLPLYQADDPVKLAAVLDRVHDASHVIIDTGGLNPFDPLEMKHLARLMTVARMEPALVLPAGTDAEESAEMAMTFEVLGVTKLIPTRLDFARRLGGLLSAADRAALSFTEGSHTPQVANGTLFLTAESLANLLMPHSTKPDKSKGR